MEEMTLFDERDLATVREVASRVAEIAALPVQEEKKAMWRKLNALEPVRPMVMIDQVCWNEMNIDDELTLSVHGRRVPRVSKVISDAFCTSGSTARSIWWSNPSYGSAKRFATPASAWSAHEEIAVTDPTNAIVGHKYENQFQTEDDLEKIRIPEVSHDVEATDRLDRESPTSCSTVCWKCARRVPIRTCPCGTPSRPGWVWRTRSTP